MIEYYRTAKGAGDRAEYLREYKIEYWFFGVAVNASGETHYIITTTPKEIGERSATLQLLLHFKPKTSR